jgi:hypothetical protein
MSPIEDAVERQVRAYNARDLETFVACYAEAVIVEDAEGTAVMSGRDELRERYRELFERFPDQHAEIVARIRVRAYVVDDERISGGPAEDFGSRVGRHGPSRPDRRRPRLESSPC